MNLFDHIPRKKVPFEDWYSDGEVPKGFASLSRYEQFKRGIDELLSIPSQIGHQIIGQGGILWELQAQKEGEPKYVAIGTVDLED